MLHEHKKITGSSAPRSTARPEGSPSCAPARHKQADDRSEAGSVLLLVTVAATTLLLFLALALDSGRLYLARTQLQSAADNAARAALVAAYQGDKVTPDASRAAGRQAADGVLANNTVINGGVSRGDGDLLYGAYDFDQRTFTAEDSGVTPGARPSAVRVQLHRSRGRGSPIAGMFAPMSVGAEAIATLRCRQISVAVDLSASFEEEIGKAKKALESMVNQLNVGDSLALVTFNGPGTNNANSPDAPATTVVIPMQPVDSANRESLAAKMRALQTCPRFGSADCLGTNTAAGLAAALAELDTKKTECNGDKVIVLMTDGVPCAPFDAPRTEQLVADTVAQADTIGRRQIGLSTIYVYDQGGGGFSISGASCPVGSLFASGAESDPTFTASLARKPGQAFDDGESQQLATLLSLSLGTVPIVIVN